MLIFSALIPALPPNSITLSELIVHEAFDADADGVVTTEELKTLLDGDSDGTISGDEAVVDLTEFVGTIYDKLPEPLRNPNNREKAVKPAYDETTQALIDAAIAARNSAAEATRVESSTTTDLTFDQCSTSDPLLTRQLAISAATLLWILVCRMSGRQCWATASR